MATSSYTFSSNTTDFTTSLLTPLDLISKKYEVALARLETYYSIPNIKRNVNNIFRYSSDGTTWKEIILDTSSYELVDINNEIERQMSVNGDYDTINNESYINIIGNTAEFKSIVVIKNDVYKVNFGGKYTIGKLLGFTGVILNSGYHKSPKVVDITPISSILVNVDIINGSYYNGANANIIYTFAPAVKPGGKIIEKPNPHEYLPISLSIINSVRIWLTDQDQRPIDNRGEELVIRLTIREISNIEESFIKAMKKMND